MSLFGAIGKPGTPGSLDKDLQALRESLKQFVRTPFFWRYVVLLLALYFIALASLLRGDVYYVDDWTRSHRYVDFNEFSRFGATFLYSALNVFHGWTDISPLTQILSVLVLAINSFMLFFIFRQKVNFFSIIAVLPLGLSPFYLENLSYKFDSITMTFSAFFAILPFLFRNSRAAFFSASVVGLIAMYSLYQASSGVYIVLALYAALMDWIKKDSNLKECAIFLVNCAISFALASLIYKFFIVVEVGGAYVSYNAHSSITGILSNLYMYVFYIYFTLKQTPFFCLMCMLCIAFPFVVALQSKQNKVLSFTAGIVFIVLGLSFSFVTYMVLETTLYVPRAFVGFSTFCTLVCLTCLNLPKHTKAMYYVMRVLIIIMGYSVIVFANAYGNALTKQIEYVKFRMELLMRDAIKVIPKSENAGFVYLNNIWLSRPTESFFKSYGEIAEVLTGTHNDPAFITSYYSFPYDKVVVNHNKVGFSACRLLTHNPDIPQELLISNAYHSISRTQGIGDYDACYIIRFNEYWDSTVTD